MGYLYKAFITCTVVRLTEILNMDFTIVCTNASHERDNKRIECLIRFVARITDLIERFWVLGIAKALMGKRNSVKFPGSPCILWRALRLISILSTAYSSCCAFKQGPCCLLLS